MLYKPNRPDKPKDALKRVLLELVLEGLSDAFTDILIQLFLLGSAFSIEIFEEIVRHNLTNTLLSCAVHLAIAATLYLIDKLKKRASKSETDIALLH